MESVRQPPPPPQPFDDGNSPSGSSDATLTALGSIPSVDTSVSGGSGYDWGATPVSLPTLEEDYIISTAHCNKNKVNSFSPGSQVMVSDAGGPYAIIGIQMGGKGADCRFGLAILKSLLFLQLTTGIYYLLKFSLHLE